MPPLPTGTTACSLSSAIIILKTAQFSSSKQHAACSRVVPWLESSHTPRICSVAAGVGTPCTAGACMAGPDQTSLMYTTHLYTCTTRLCSDLCIICIGRCVIVGVGLFSA